MAADFWQLALLLKLLFRIRALSCCACSSIGPLKPFQDFVIRLP